MFSQERQRRILTELEQRGRVEVAELAGRFGVSEDTVRRDLKALAGRGYLHKTHGGAVALDPGRMSWAARADLMGDAKAAIGALAATLVQPGQTVLLDAGRVVADGPTPDVLGDPYLLEAHSLEMPLSLKIGRSV